MATGSEIGRLWRRGAQIAFAVWCLYCESVSQLSRQLCQMLTSFLDLLDPKPRSLLCIPKTASQFEAALHLAALPTLNARRQPLLKLDQQDMKAFPSRQRPIMNRSRMRQLVGVRPSDTQQMKYQIIMRFLSVVRPRSHLNTMASDHCRYRVVIGGRSMTRGPLLIGGLL